jgi:hypothetical protein
VREGTRKQFDANGCTGRAPSDSLASSADRHDIAAESMLRRGSEKFSQKTEHIAQYGLQQDPVSGAALRGCCLSRPLRRKRHARAGSRQASHALQRAALRCLNSTPNAHVYIKLL